MSFATRARHAVCLLGLLLMPQWLSACGGQAASPPAGGRLRVVATFSILGDLVGAVGQEHIDLRTLAGPGQDTHSFEPRPADSAALSGAGLIFENGLGFETWLDDLYAASASGARRVVVTDGLELLTPAGEPDPHVWQSVPNVIHIVARIVEALSQADPANAEAYQANGQAYTARLRELDEWIAAQADSLPAGQRRLVTTHDTFGYFAQRYGFEIVGAVLPTSTEGASPSAQELAALVQAVRAAGVPAVFGETSGSNNLLQQVAEEAGVRLAGALYTDALGAPGSDGDTYLNLMRANTTRIVGALRP